MVELKNPQKKLFLEKEGFLNPKPDRVVHPLFKTLSFFDPLDLPQVRYELLRCARGGECSVLAACEVFGFSREYFYKLDRTFMERGYVALLGSQVGRRPLIALNQEIVSYVVMEKMKRPKASGDELRKEIEKLYKVECSTRTVERVIEKAGLGKKGVR